MTVLPPRIIYWLMETGIVLTSLPRSEGSFLSRQAFKRIGKPWIPLGATHWKAHWLKEWAPVSELPPQWGLTRVGKATHEADPDEMDEAELQQWRARQKPK